MMLNQNTRLSQRSELAPRASLFIRRSVQALVCVLMVCVSSCGDAAAPVEAGPNPWVGVYTKPGMKITVTKPDIDYRGTLEIEVKKGEKPTVDELKLELVGGLMKGYLVREHNAFMMFKLKREGGKYLLVSGGKEEPMERDVKEPTPKSKDSK